MVDLRLFVFPWLALSWILPFPERTLCAQHANVNSVVFPVVAVEGFCFPSNAPSDAAVVLAIPAGSNVSSGRAGKRRHSAAALGSFPGAVKGMEPNLEQH